MKKLQYRKSKKTGKTYPLRKNILLENKALLLELENQVQALQKKQAEEITALKKASGSVVEMKALLLKQVQQRTALRKKGGQQRTALRKRQGSGGGHVWGHYLSQERKGKAEKWGEWTE